jgi:hypothetical protein
LLAAMTAVARPIPEVPPMTTTFWLSIEPMSFTF